MTKFFKDIFNKYFISKKEHEQIMKEKRMRSEQLNRIYKDFEETERKRNIMREKMTKFCAIKDSECDPDKKYRLLKEHLSELEACCKKLYGDLED